MKAKKKPAKRSARKEHRRSQFNRELRSGEVAMAPPVIYREPELLKLDLGSGPRPAEGFKGVDIVPGVTDFCVDLCIGEKWPWADSSVDELRSSHQIEHIDAGCIWTFEAFRDGPLDRLQVRRIRGMNAFYFFFEEAFRVAKDGATFHIQWPALQNVRAWQDPTHQHFIPAERIGYLSIEGRKALGQDYLGLKCNWVGSCAPTIPGPTPDEQKEAEAMALRADSSDEKQAWYAKVQTEQGRRYRETWNFSQDFIAILKAIKT